MRGQRWRRSSGGSARRPARQPILPSRASTEHAAAVLRHAFLREHVTTGRGRYVHFVANRGAVRQGTRDTPRSHAAGCGDPQIPAPRGFETRPVR